MGVAGSAGSFGQFLIVPLAGQLISVAGWQEALVMLGGAALVILPLAWALREPQFAGGGPVRVGPSLVDVGTGMWAVIGILSARKQTAIIPVAVAAWIGSAYFFTSSTSFANPAVTVGRMFTDTFAGIAPESVLPYIAAQLVGAAIGAAVVAAVTKSAPTSAV
jgi:glycerol uptake facilitator-like aquaporin